MELSTYLDNIGTILGSVGEWVIDCAGMVCSHPMLLVPTVISVGLIGLSVVKRFT